MPRCVRPLNRAWSTARTCHRAWSTAHTARTSHASASTAYAPSYAPSYASSSPSSPSSSPTFSASSVPHPIDCFGNPLQPGYPYARGNLVRCTTDDIAKLEYARRVMRKRRESRRPLYNFSGLDRSMTSLLRAEDFDLYDDDLGPAVVGAEFKMRALDHLGGSEAEDHDVLLCNRQSAAMMATCMALLERGDRVIGVSPTYSHPAVTRPVQRAGAHFTDVRGYAGFAAELDKLDRSYSRDGAPPPPPPKMVMLTRLAVSYEILSAEELRDIVQRAHAVGAIVVCDDAGGARVGPAVFGQDRTLELGVDVGSTGLDKYGVLGPRVGLLGGRRDLVDQIRVAAMECGLDARGMLLPAVLRSLAQYREGRVRDLVACTMEVAGELEEALGAENVAKNALIAQLRGEDILRLAMQRAGWREGEAWRPAGEGGEGRPPLVPLEATAALAALMLQRHGMNTVHYAGIPPGTPNLLIKFIPPEVLEGFGGARRFAEAVDDCVWELSRLLPHERELEVLMYGEGGRP